MPSLFAIGRSNALPIAFLFLHFSISSIAAPFVPIIRKPIPIINGGLNLYPHHVLYEDTEGYTFGDEDMHFDQDFRNPMRGAWEQQHELMNQVNGKFIKEFLRTPEDYEHYTEWDESHGKALTGGDIFHKSGSSDIEGRGKLRITPAGKRRYPWSHPKTNPQSLVEDNQYQYPSKGRLIKRDMDPDSMLKPQTICDFLHLPLGCPNGLVLPVELLNMPIVSIEVEHSEQSWRVMKDLDSEDPETQPPQGTNPEGGPPLTGPGALKQNLDAFVPVFLKIGFLPSTAKALGVDETAIGFLDMPISGIPTEIPYTDTLTRYHEVQTICLSRETGPFVVCERVYGEEDTQADAKESADLSVDINNRTTTISEMSNLDHII